MAKAKKSPAAKKPKAALAAPKPGRGRPTKYSHDYPMLLIKHMSKGFNFKSFGAVVKPPVAEHTLFDWLKAHPEFLQSKKIGESLLEQHYLRVSQMIALGQVKVPVRTVPVMHNGVPVMDPENPGKVLYDTTYEPARCQSAVHIFMLKNILGWCDQRDVKHSGDPANPVAHRTEMQVVDSTERLQELSRLQAKRELLGGD